KHSDADRVERRSGLRRHDRPRKRGCKRGGGGRRRGLGARFRPWLRGEQYHAARPSIEDFGPGSLRRRLRRNVLALVGKLIGDLAHIAEELVLGYMPVVVLVCRAFQCS